MSASDVGRSELPGPKGRFSRGDRVRKRSDFRRIQEGGERVVSETFVFLLGRAPEGCGPRLGITASRRVGNAITRNRAKRLVREAFRATRSFWPDAADVLVIVRHALGERKLADVIREWQASQSRIARRWARLGERSKIVTPAEPQLVKKSC